MGEPTAFEALTASVSQQFATVFQSPVPFIIVVAIVSIAIWRAIQWRYGGKIERLTDEVDSLRRGLGHAKMPLKAEVQSFKEKRLATKEDTPECSKVRIFVPDNVTPRYLTDFWRQNTKLQAGRETDHFKGKWIRVSGKLVDIEERPEFYYVHIQHEQRLDSSTIAHDHILLVFRHDIERVEMLQRDRVISATGWIERIDNRGLTLEDCELTG